MKYTFGKTLAAQRLEILLYKDPSARRKISTLLSQYTDKLIKIVAIDDPSTVHLCMALLRDFTHRRIDVKKNLSGDIRTYSKNVVTSRYRVYRQTYDEIVAVMEDSRKNKQV